MSTPVITRTLKATARRDGRWWFIEIPELDTVGQARTVSDIDDVAREVAALWLDVDPSAIEVDVDLQVPEEVKTLWSTANAKELDAREAVKDAARLRRDAVRALTGQGITQTDAAKLLGLSVQRVSQLAHS